MDDRARNLLSRLRYFKSKDRPALVYELNELQPHNVILDRGGLWVYGNVGVRAIYFDVVVVGGVITKNRRGESVDVSLFYGDKYDRIKMDEALR